MEKENWVIRKIEIDKGVKFFELVNSMKAEEVLLDCHIENLLVFHPRTDLHAYWMVFDGYLVLQDKVFFCILNTINKFIINLITK